MNKFLKIMKEPVKQALESWDGKVGKLRARKVKKQMILITKNYSKHLGISRYEVMKAIEEKRTYSSINYYDESKFPLLGNEVMIFENQNEAKKYIEPEKGFRCPSCSGKSMDPYSCDTNKNESDGKKCNWKAYGLFGTIGKGLIFTIKENFLKSPKIDEIFMPITLEKKGA